jgi:TolA-binding protein
MRCFWTPPALSLDTKEDRLAVRKALYDMLRAVPPPADPCADWSNDHWGMLVELLVPYHAGPILLDIFNRGFDTLQKRPPEERWALEDRFVETLRLQRNDQLLLDWIARLEKNERNSARKFRWKDERVCAYLFDIDDPEAARRETTFLKEAAIGPDQTQIAALRQGDVARALGQYDAALKFYKDAQDRFRSRHKTGTAGGRLTYVGARKQQRDADTNTAGRAASRRPATQSLTSRVKVDDWKVYTVHDASMYATISSFLEQDALAEAFQKLSDWENESPASKLSGDYPMAEAKIYITVGDLRRAINALAAYRKSVTMSAQLADAMKLEIECRLQLNDKTRAKEIATDFIRRFPGHPYEADMKEILTR